MKTSSLLTTLIACFAFSLMTSAAHAAFELSAQAIVKRTLDRNLLGIQNGQADMVLTTYNRRGQAKSKFVHIRSYNPDGQERSLIRFQSPKAVAGTGLLLLESDHGDDQQYLYLPALSKVKRISGSQKTQSFMGTDLTYSDIESRDLKTAELSRLEDQEIAGSPVYVVEAIPAKGLKSDYTKMRLWLHQESFVPLRIDFYGSKGKLVKELKVTKLARQREHWVTKSLVVNNLKKKTRTQISIQNAQFDVPMNDSQFTQRALTES